MFAVQWLCSILLIAFSLFVAFGQWYSAYTIPKKLNAQGQPRNYSMIPLVGGVFGMFGCFACPNPTIRGLWWLPLLLDPGCALMFGAVAVFGIVSLFRRNTDS